MINSIVLLLIMIIAVFIILKILKSLILVKVAFKLISLIFIVGIVILVVLGISILSDANKFRNEFSSQDSLFLLTDNGKIISAVELKTKEDSQSYRSVDDSRLSNLQKSLDKYGFSDINDDYYKIIIIKTDLLPNIKEYDLDQLEIKITSMVNLLNTSNTERALAELKAKYNKTNYDDALKIVKKINEPNLKSYVFSYVITELFNPKNIQIFMREIKNDNILVYENTAMFRAIKIVPSFMLKDILNKGSNSSIFNNSVII